MLNDYLAALIARWYARGLAHSALPERPVQPDRKRRRTDQDRPTEVPLRHPDQIETAAPPGSPEPAQPDGSWWIRCPCGQWGWSRKDRSPWLALCQHLFPELDQELDVWQDAHGWLYR
jgi:hypothetical protein